MYGHDSGIPAKTRQRRRDRIMFSRDQRNALEALFKASSHPDELTRINVANTIDVSERRVQIWFKNRRVRWRNEAKLKENGIIGGTIHKKRNAEVRPILTNTCHQGNALTSKNVGYAAALSLSGNVCGDVTIQPMAYCLNPNIACQGYSNSYYSASVHYGYQNVPYPNTDVDTSRNGYQANFFSDNQHPVMFHQQQKDDAYMYSSAFGRSPSPMTAATDTDLDMISYSDLLNVNEC